MSKPSRRPNREQIKAQRREKKKQEAALRERQEQAGLKPSIPPALPNACCAYATVDEEREARTQAATGQLGVLRQQLPFLLRRLEKIPDPRAPKRIRHKLTVLLLYGLLMFVFQFASRREVNREMTQPCFEQNLRLLFPELETLPHADTLYRLLRDIDVAQLEELHLGMVEKLIRGKKFRRFLIQNAYPLAIDGTQKLGGDILWDIEMLERTHGQGESARTQYYVYVLEASLSFSNGMVIPLCSEFLGYGLGDSERQKQDCEQRAFERLAARIKKRFPRLPLLLLLDGLYATGPVIARCREYHWDFMIVLQDGSLGSVWEEFRGLLPLQPKNRLERTWNGRRQRFAWVEGIRYEYGANGRHHQTIHVVTCEESWEELDEASQLVTKHSLHAWISSRPLSRLNVHERCNLAARSRWGIESAFLVEKHQGYHYEHPFARDWNAMRGYHALMRLAHLFNTLARFAAHLKGFYARLGVRGMIAFVRSTCASPWFESATAKAAMEHPPNLRLE